MGYTDPYIWNFTVNCVGLSAPYGDNVDVAFILVEPQKEITILDMRGFVQTISGVASDSFELVDANTSQIKCLIKTGAGGYVQGLLPDKVTPAPFPIVIPPRTGNSLFYMRMDGTAAAGTKFCVQVRLTGL